MAWNSWNYRVVHRVQHGGDIFAIHEAYYTDNQPTLISENPTHPLGETPDELKQEFEAFTRALAQPILEYEDFDAAKAFA